MDEYGAGAKIIVVVLRQYVSRDRIMQGGRDQSNGIYWALAIKTVRYNSGGCSSWAVLST